jgi:phosphoglycerate dehydrogenase-like enzyme/nickel-dependent lactate racemase
LHVVNLAEDDRQLLRRAGCNVKGYQWKGVEGFLSAEEIETQIIGQHVLIVGLDQVSRRAMEGGAQLRIVAKYGTGVDNIDVEAATELGIAVINAPGANKIAVAELTLGLMFSLARWLPQHHTATRNGSWHRQVGTELCGKTLGIVGLGQIGREVARRANHLGMRVVAHDIVWDSEFATTNNVQRLSLEEVLECADIVSLHLPQTPETLGIIDSEKLVMMRVGAMLVNTARGSLIDHDALYGALTSGRLAGAALDVFAVEPPFGDLLLDLNNVIVSPHLGARTAESRVRMSHMLTEGILAVLRGERPKNVVNPEVYAKRKSVHLAAQAKEAVKIELPYGQLKKAVMVPSENLVWNASPDGQPGVSDPVSAIRQAIEHPIGSPSLRRLAHNLKGEVVILVDDGTRVTPQALILPILLDELNRAGVPDEHIFLLVATGTHRPMTSEEQLDRFGGRVLERVRVENLDAEAPDAFVELGTTPSGVPVQVSRRYYEAALKIGVGNIVPHPTAGYSGGAKIVQPGVCSPTTTAKTHMIGARQGLGILGQVENPVRAEMEDIARRAGLRFIVNTVLNREKRIVAVVAGDLVAAHRQGVALAEQIYTVTVPELADIVVVSSHPADRDLWQGVKAICSATEVVRPGGEVILITPSPEGVSEEHPCLSELGDASWQDVLTAVDNGCIDDEVGASCQILLGLARDKVNVTIVSDGICAGDVLHMGLRYASTPEEALGDALVRLGQESRIGVATEGGELILRCSDAPQQRKHSNTTIARM